MSERSDGPVFHTADHGPAPGLWLCKACRLVDQGETVARADMDRAASCWRCKAPVAAGERMYFVKPHDRERNYLA